MTDQLPRITRVVDPDEIAALLRGREDIGTPIVYTSNDGCFWVKSDELFMWRHARLAPQSGAASDAK